MRFFFRNRFNVTTMFKAYTKMCHDECAKYHAKIDAETQHSIEKCFLTAWRSQLPPDKVPNEDKRDDRQYMQAYKREIIRYYETHTTNKDRVKKKTLETAGVNLENIEHTEGTEIPHIMQWKLNHMLEESSNPTRKNSQHALLLQAGMRENEPTPSGNFTIKTIKWAIMTELHCDSVQAITTNSNLEEVKKKIADDTGACNRYILQKGINQHYIAVVPIRDASNNTYLYIDSIGPTREEYDQLQLFQLLPECDGIIIFSGEECTPRLQPLTLHIVKQIHAVNG